jgi:hypothetical protein
MIQGKNLLPRTFWSVDVGNYGISRASSYAATAAAAKEFGDTDVATAIFEHLQRECPSVLINQAMHREKSSFWAHSAEVLARSTTTNSFASMMQPKPKPVAPTPKFNHMDYRAAFILRARSDAAGLSASILGDGVVDLEVTDLLPFERYAVNQQLPVTRADAQGNARFSVLVNGTSEVNICRVP